MREQHVRHYTRDRAGRIQVCSVEIWSFESQRQAESAHAGFRFPGWKIDRVGRLLVMVRGLVQGRGMGPKRGVFPGNGLRLLSGSPTQPVATRIRSECLARRPPACRDADAPRPQPVQDDHL